MMYGVAAIPTLIILNKDGTMVTNTARADVSNLNVRCYDRWAGLSSTEEKSESGGVQTLSSFIEAGQSQCLNQSSEHTLKDLLSKGSGKYLESDADEQLLLTIAFKNEVSIRSIVMRSNKDGRAPKGVKFFLNNTHMDFNDADSETSLQDFSLTDKDYKEVSKGEVSTELTFKNAKFKKVRSITMFIYSNMGKKDTTMISELTVIAGDGQKKEEEMKFDVKDLKAENHNH